MRYINIHNFSVNPKSAINIKIPNKGVDGMKWCWLCLSLGVYDTFMFHRGKTYYFGFDYMETGRKGKNICTLHTHQQPIEIKRLFIHLHVINDADTIRRPNIIGQMNWAQWRTRNWMRAVVLTNYHFNKYHPKVMNI